jgi:hypothetical protein
VPGRRPAVRHPRVGWTWHLDPYPEHLFRE